MSHTHRWHQLPALEDNYIYILEELETHDCVVVDPGHAEHVLKFFLNRPGLRLKAIFLTHHHQDHVAGVEALRSVHDCQVYGNECDPALTSLLTLPLKPGCGFESLGGLWKVLSCPGHTKHHVAFYQEDLKWLLSGDVLFSLGCGRLFEGSFSEMLSSLDLLASLPSETLVFAAHEYTLRNLNFSLSILPKDSKLLAFREVLSARMAQGMASVPTTMGFERDHNLFLRLDDQNVISSLAGSFESRLERFVALRTLRNEF